MATTYWDYLRLDRLLDLQGGIEGDESALMSDELHFIIVHQAYELWFKLCLRELRLGRDHLAEPKVPEEQIPYVVHHLRRVTSILELCVAQFKVMETLTPQDFLAFRDKLMPASGFQSFQMRELEIVLGLEESVRQSYGGTDPLEHVRTLAESSPGGQHAWGRIEAARREPSLKSALDEWLYRTPVQGSSPGDAGDEEVVLGFLTEYYERLVGMNAQKKADMLEALGKITSSIEQRFTDAEAYAHRFLFAEDVEPERRARARRIRAGVLFVEAYRELPLLAWPRLLIDTVVATEEEFVIWRSRHARMVERVIGRRIGTGGSAGVEYLDSTVNYRVFKDLWAVRAILLPKTELPQLRRQEVYGFAQ